MVQKPPAEAAADGIFRCIPEESDGGYRAAYYGRTPALLYNKSAGRKKEAAFCRFMPYIVGGADGFFAAMIRNVKFDIN